MDIKGFRDGIFSLRTRRFGTVAELMIEALNKFHKSKNQFHDRYDDVNKKRIEIKFSTVLKENEATISSANLIEQVFAANISNRAVTSDETKTISFDCNIQQVKCAEFDVLYYGCFFADKIAIYKMTNAEVKTAVGYSDKQHKGNVGEGQFHINNATKDWHDKNHFVQWLDYEELFNLFCNK
jgi:hypothetical protein